MRLLCHLALSSDSHDIHFLTALTFSRLAANPALRHALATDHTRHNNSKAAQVPRPPSPFPVLDVTMHACRSICDGASLRS